MKFEQPLDVDYLLAKRKRIKKGLLADATPRQPLKVAVLGGSTTSEIINQLEIFLLNKGYAPEFYESDYNCYYEDVILGNADLLAFKPDIVYLHTSHVNITRFPGLKDSEKKVDELLAEEVKRFQDIWDKLSQIFTCDILQNNFDLPSLRSLGNLDATAPQGKVNYITRLNLAFGQAAQKQPNLHIQDINYLSASLGINKWWDQRFYWAYKYALSFTAIPHLAFNLTNLIMVCKGKAKKCLVLDLDNTLWGGIIGEVGMEGITLGQGVPVGEAFTALQTYVLELKEKGVALAVCSKNEEENARAGFTHPESSMTTEDFAVFKANWLTKSENIAAIAKEINLGLDSFVFLDDNPAEREIIQQQFPQVAVPNVGEEIENFITRLDANGYFESLSLQAEDLARAEYYQNNLKRDAEKIQFQDYGTYLESLEMTGEIAPFAPAYLERVTQLINKTNQFNLTTQRQTAQEVKEISNSDNYITLYGRLKDKFGDNGITSVLLGEIIGDELHIRVWVMSCRVFKRQLELAMFDELVKECQKRKVKQLVGYYLPTQKNKIVKGLYLELGFEAYYETPEETRWRGQVSPDYSNKNQHIKVNDEA